MENNKRLSPHASPSKTRSFSAVLRESVDADLNSFFPFDPYKLPLSSSYIEPVYRDWTSVAIDDDEEDEEDEEDENIGDLPVTSSQPRRIGGTDDDDTAALGTSFGGMSISPMRPSLMTSSLT